MARNSRLYLFSFVRVVNCAPPPPVLHYICSTLHLSPVWKSTPPASADCICICYLVQLMISDAWTSSMLCASPDQYTLLLRVQTWIRHLISLHAIVPVPICVWSMYWGLCLRLAQTVSSSSSSSSSSKLDKKLSPVSLARRIILQ